MRNTSPLMLALIGAGLILVWSAVHGANVTVFTRDLLAGKRGL